MTPQTGTLYWLPRILADERLDPTETLLLIGLADHVNSDDRCWVGIKRLASYARVSYATACRRLSSLEQKGIIVRERRTRDDGGDSVYDYQLVRDPHSNLSRPPRAPGCSEPPARQDARAEVPLENLPNEQAPAPAAKSADDRHARFAAAAKIIGERAGQRPGIERPGAMANSVARGVMRDRHEEAYRLLAADPWLTAHDLADRLDSPKPSGRKYVGPPPVAEVLPDVPIDPVGNVAATRGIRSRLGWDRKSGDGKVESDA